ncbi:hypothetical protein BJX62DRAFT_238326 [Aspergillus germanicus]
MIYWNQFPVLRTTRCPDINFVWVQAYEALSSEVFLSPGMSTVISIILNVGGRPSTSIFCNGGMMGLAVAFANALGLNRDPSNWNISPMQKQIRINIWWLVVVQDSWCSLAYGTPLLINRAQHDVPVPTFHSVCADNASPSQTDAATTFISFVTLTQVLGRYLEYIYRVKSSTQDALETPSTEDLEFLGNWEETLSDNVRRIVLRGTKFEGPGAANLGLAYLAVKLLLRRIQLDLDPGTPCKGRQSDSPVQLRVQRAAEEIVHFVQELDERHLRGFWHPATGPILFFLLTRTLSGSRTHTDHDTAIIGQNQSIPPPLIQLGQVCIQAARSSYTLLIDQWTAGRITGISPPYAHWLFSTALVLAVSSQINAQGDDGALSENNIYSQATTTHMDTDPGGVQIIMDILRNMAASGNLPAAEYLRNLEAVWSTLVTRQEHSGVSNNTTAAALESLSVLHTSPSMSTSAKTTTTPGAGAATSANAGIVSSSHLAPVDPAGEDGREMHSQVPHLQQGLSPQQASYAPLGPFHNLPDLELNNYEEIEDALVNWNITGPLWVD